MVKLVTVVTHDDGYLKWLEASCKRFNVKLIKLGWGEQWINYIWRFTKMIQFLNTNDPEELIIFIDAHDVILLRPLTDIENVFNNIIKITGKKIIISTENYPTKIDKCVHNIFGRLKFGQCKNTFINAGTYMGKAKDLLTVYNNIIKTNVENIDDDQLLLTTYCQNNQDIFYIDNDFNIFLVVTCYDDILLNKNFQLFFSLININKKEIIIKII
jgi:hypothetical protein